MRTPLLASDAPVAMPGSLSPPRRPRDLLVDSITRPGDASPWDCRTRRSRRFHAGQQRSGRRSPRGRRGCRRDRRHPVDILWI